MEKICWSAAEPFYITDTPGINPEFIRLIVKKSCVELHHDPETGTIRVRLTPVCATFITVTSIAEAKAAISKGHQVLETEGVIAIGALKHPVTIRRDGVFDANKTWFPKHTIPRINPVKATKAEKFASQRLANVWARWPEFIEEITLKADGSAVMHRVGTTPMSPMMLTPFRHVTMYLKGGPRYEAMLEQCNRPPEEDEDESYDWD